MITLTPQMIASVLPEAIPQIACVLPRDISDSLKAACDIPTNAYESQVLSYLCENARIAKEDRVPICQDTGTVWLCLEIGPDVCISGDIFSLVDEAVAKAYVENGLRLSVVKDAFFNRENTRTNTPVFKEIRFVDTPGVARLHLMLKGGGSDNASRLIMLAPGVGKQGIIDELLKCVKEKAANACPPLIIGVGIGATFDKVGSLAKHALMRPVGSPAQDEEHAAFEAELLELVNASGVGAAGFGGKTTALAVHVETAPCHIAAFPLAINMGCSAMRRISIDLLAGESHE